MKKIFLSPIFMPIAVLGSMLIGGICQVIQTVENAKVSKEVIATQKAQQKALLENKEE